MLSSARLAPSFLTPNQKQARVTQGAQASAADFFQEPHLGTWGRARVWTQVSFVLFFVSEILSSSIRSYNAEDNEKFKTIVEFECRGLEPVDFQPQAGFAAEGVESGTAFGDINLQEKDWTDYDEKAQESVGIYEVAHQFVKC
ncbi:CXXC motif containing zinc binding protein [Phyllostomus discolor]|uniref:CXXC motif containing zinc binding protein n=1 Tax=Phyllostomus discolor TaxID=89673 RepID=A0A834A9B8_9CHIR|nr:CXXC motif containing zinc binding protein [Phyllostomus discolor]